MMWEPSDALVEKAARAAKPDAWKKDERFNALERRWRRDASLDDARAALIAARDDMVAEAVRAEAEACVHDVELQLAGRRVGGVIDALHGAIKNIRARQP